MNEEYIIDEFDKKLLKLLKINSRMKNTELARRLNVTEGAIRKRIKKLVQANYIEKFTIEINEDKLSGTWAIVNIKIAGDMSPSQIRDKIMENVKGIEEIYETAGDIDLIVIFNTSGDVTLKAAIEELRNIDGITSTRSYIALNRIKINQNIFS